MRVLIDTDVILDVFLKRQPFVQAAAELWRANEEGRFDGYVSAITPVNVFYIARKVKGAETAREAVAELLDVFRVCKLDECALETALRLPVRDYEDAVQCASAAASQLDVIVTRNVEDYADAPLPVFSPDDFLKQLPPPDEGVTPTQT